ncbi:MAG: RICIN domain-containing protein [Plesiomonas shigelloides]
MLGTFKYAANTSMVLGVSDQITSACAVLLPANSSLDKILWNVNTQTGHICLAESQDLVLGISNKSISTGSLIVLQERNANDQTQMWDMVSKSGFILSRANPSYVIDDSARGQAPNTKIQLYPFNGSPAQKWIFVPTSMMAAFLEEDSQTA